jgi:signal transduction histidine kinase/HPt (histidine-containing phosphotransfer) domain-containing protein
MPLLRRLSSTPNVLGCLGIAASLMAFATWKLHATMVDADVSAVRLDQAEEVLVVIGRFRGSVRNIVAGERGYLLSRDPSFAADRDEAQQQAESALARLQALVAEDRRQSARVAELAARFNARLATSRDALTSSPAFGSVEPGSRKATAEALTLANAIEQEERSLLEQRRLENTQRRHEELTTLALSLGGFAVTTLVTGAALFVESRRRRRSQRQLSEIVENLPLTVWQVLSRGPGQREFVYLGHGSLRERGIAECSVGWDANTVMRNVHEEDRAALSQVHDAAEHSRETIDHVYRVRTGEAVRWLHVRARASSVPQGTLWTGYWADVTQHKEIEQSLRDATRAAQSASTAKSSSLAIMSHEIRTPLNGMLGLLELLELTQLTRDQRATLAVVVEAGRSLSQIIDDILDLTRVEAGRLDLHPLAASLSDAVMRATQVHRGVAVAKGLQLDWWVDPRLAPALLFDPLRVGQILNNFISNALKFTPEGGVRVAAELFSEEPGKQRVRLSVADTGMGIAPETIARIFEPFVQAEPDTAARYGGSGLGLSICRQLAQAMGGDIHMHSVPGAGSRIVLDATFPIALQPAAAARPQGADPELVGVLAARRTPASVEDAELQGTLVLVVDDHPTNRLVLARQLAALGYTALTAENGNAALQTWTSRKIGLVLCDCYMPGLSGFELARAIRERERSSAGMRVPIVACTASALAAERQRCIAAGMDACLAKPVDLLRLMEQLEIFLPLPALAGVSPAPPFLPNREALAEFERMHASDLRALDLALAARDFVQAGTLAHRMAGASAVIGAGALASCCHALEEGARLQNAPCMEIDLAELREQTDRFRRELAGEGAGTQANALS